MQRVIIDEPYVPVTPYRGTLVERFFRLLLPRHLRNAHGITEWECRGAEHLKESIRAGHGTLLCPNHCRPSDPMAMGLVNIVANHSTFSLASWHVFKQNRTQTFLSRQFGAFSIYREGLDRQALNSAIEIVVNAERPLIVFPEGVISRRNDSLLPLMDGTSFIARSAAKKRAKDDPNKKTVIHPVALKYEFLGDIDSAVDPILMRLEERLTWIPSHGTDLLTRINRIAQGFLSLKELEYMGEASSGSIYDRTPKLIEAMLTPIEEEWLGGPQTGHVVSRVKNIRAAILPDMANNKVDAQERDRRWKHLAAAYYAQQINFYERGYVDEGCPPEHILETVESLEEDVTDVATIHSPLKLYISIGEPIEVEAKRPRGEADPVMTQLTDQLSNQIAAVGDEIAQRRAVT